MGAATVYEGASAVKAGLDDADLMHGQRDLEELRGEIATATMDAARRMHHWWWDRERVVGAEEEYQRVQRAKRATAKAEGVPYEPDPPSHRPDVADDGRRKTIKPGDQPDYPLSELRRQGKIDPVREAQLTALAYRLALMHRAGTIQLFEGEEETPRREA